MATEVTVHTGDDDIELIPLTPDGKLKDKILVLRHRIYQFDILAGEALVIGPIGTSDKKEA
jgi:hypothetical protein